MIEIKKRIIAATPMIVLVSFLWIGFETGKWHPAWLLFLLVPIIPIILGVKKIKFSFEFIIFVVYIMLGIFLKYWHPGWLIFMLIPIYHTLIIPKKKEKTLKE